MPPVPWTNVVAHETFGFACTESSAGYTWSGNSHDNRLTPWRNDPVGDPPGEAVFIRDEETGAFWSATPLPAGGGHPYQTRHGQGYSVYEHARDGIASELTLFVPRGRAREDLSPRAQEHRRLAAPALGDALRRMGARGEPLAHRHPRRDRHRSGHRRRDRHQPLPPGVREPRRRSRPVVRISAGAKLHRRSNRVHRPQRLAGPAGGARARPALEPRRRRLTIPAARSASHSISVRRKNASSSACSATWTMSRRFARWSSASGILRPSTRR